MLAHCIPYVLILSFLSLAITEAYSQSAQSDNPPSERAYDKYMRCIDELGKDRSKRSIMEGKEINTLLRRNDAHFVNHPFESRGKWINFRGPTMEVIQSFPGTKSYKGKLGEIYVARRWHEQHSILDTHGSAIRCLEDKVNSVGSILYVTKFLNRNFRWLQGTPKKSSIKNASTFFGFQTCVNNKIFHFPNTAYLNGALDAASIRLQAINKEPILVRYYEVDDILESTEEFLGRFANNYEWPRAMDGYYLHHDTFFHTVIAFYPPWVVKEMAEHIAYILDLVKLINEKKSLTLKRRYKKETGMLHTEQKEILDILLRYVAYPLDPATANISVMFAIFLDSGSATKLGKTSEETLGRFFKSWQDLHNTKSEKIYRKDITYWIANKLPTRIKHAFKYASIMIQIGKENGIEPPAPSKLIDIAQNNEHEAFGYEILRRREEIIDVAHSF